MNLSDSLRFYAATDVGKVRDHNEDNFLVDKKLALFVVADGMGGHAAGEVASAIAVRTVHDEIRRDKEMLDDYASGATGSTKVTRKDIIALIEHAVQRACSKIHDEALGDANKRGMGTTLSALLVAGDQGFIAHVGDSRIYLARGDHVQQVTEDHTVFNELIKRGKLTREQIEKVQQKNAITRAVGVKMLWQFLGVLADRLDQTNSELHQIKRESIAEDVTAEIFPEIEEESLPPASLSR